MRGRRRSAWRRRLGVVVAAMTAAVLADRIGAPDAAGKGRGGGSFEARSSKNAALVALPVVQTAAGRSVLSRGAPARQQCAAGAGRSQWGALTAIGRSRRGEGGVSARLTTYSTD